MLASVWLERGQAHNQTYARRAAASADFVEQNDRPGNDMNQETHHVRGGITQRFSLISLFVVVAVIAISIVLVMRVRHELRTIHIYTAFMIFTSDRETLDAVSQSNAEFPYHREKNVNGIRIFVGSVGDGVHERGTGWAAVFQVSGTGLTHAERRRELEAQMDAFKKQFPSIHFETREVNHEISDIDETAPFFLP